LALRYVWDCGAAVHGLTFVAADTHLPKTKAYGVLAN
jgi:hypothetical protein